MIHITKIYLVTNCYSDPNKVYIGKTKNCRKANHQKTYGEQIEYTYIDEINSLNHKIWGPLETYWIEQFKAWGFEIMNPRKKGGGGPEFVKEETKNKISSKHKGMKKPWISDARKGKKLSPGHIEKIKSKITGLKRTLQTKEKMKETRKGVSKPEGFGEKVSKSLTGYKRTEQNKKNISDGLIGRSKSKETKEKMSINSKDKNNKPVIQYDKKMNFLNEFKSLTEACLFLNKPNMQGSITNVCKGKKGRKTAFGYIWKYKEN